MPVGGIVVQVDMKPLWLATTRKRLWRVRTPRTTTESNLHPKYTIDKKVVGMNWVNSLWPNDVIWRHRSESTLPQVMAWCLKAPSHYLSQCWHEIIGINPTERDMLTKLLITNAAFRGPFYWHGLTLIPTWISNYIHYKLWDKITYPFLNVNGATVMDK